MKTSSYSRLVKLISEGFNFCHQHWQGWREKIQPLRQLKLFPVAQHSAFSAGTQTTNVETAPKRTVLTTTQWALDKQAGKKRYVIVEIDSHPHHSSSTGNLPTKNNLYYTIGGKDPNLRITHYPPSNRLH